MTNHPLAPPILSDPNTILEQALIAEFLHERGYRLDELAMLPVDEARQLLAEASRFASIHLAEVEARAHFVELIEESRPHR